MTLALPASDLRQLIPLADAITATMNGSDSGFYRWCARWGVESFRHGKYRKSDLADGMAREEAAKKRRARK